MKKKILFFIPTLDGGGAEKALVNLVNTFDLAKYEIDVVTIFGGGVNQAFLKPGVTIRSIFKKHIKGLKHIFKLFTPKLLYRFFFKNTYDIAIAYLEGECTRIISGSEKSTVKIAWVHIERKHDYVCAFRNYSEMIKAYSSFNKICFVSDDTKKSFDKYTDSIFQEKECVIKNIVDYATIFKQSTEEIKITQKDYFNIISVGRLTKIKDMNRLIDLYLFLKSKNILVNILILGIGEEYENLKKRIADLKIENNIKLLGYQLNPYRYIAKSDLYVCTSHKEGYSTTVLESVVLGVPVVTTNCSGMIDILDNGKCGIIVNDNNKELFNAVYRIIQDRTEYLDKKNNCLLRSKELVKLNLLNIKNNHQEIGIK